MLEESAYDRLLASIIASFAIFKQMSENGRHYCDQNDWSTDTGRGVQYVHCEMHKCIMVKVGGNEKQINYAKTRKFDESMGEILRNVGKE